jgi:hypothetical protein
MSLKQGHCDQSLCQRSEIFSFKALQTVPVGEELKGAVAHLTSFQQEHPWWSVFWDKAYGVWRVAEDDPNSALYAESADAVEVLRYMAARS